MVSVFLSYSSQDNSLAKRISKDLRAAGINVWLDEWEILVGDSISQRIQQGLERVDFVAVLLTQHSVESGWVEKEWQSKIGEEAEKRKVVVLPLKAGECQIPLLLKDKRYADFSYNYITALNDLLTALEGHVRRDAGVTDINRSSAQSLFYLHPQGKPSFFVGRLREIEQLNEALNFKAPSIIAVIGMGGQGKTTLVHKVLGDLVSFPFSIGFCCTAYRGGFTFDEFLDEALSYFIGKNFDKRNMADVNIRVTRILGLLQRRPILLVIDGIERWLWGWNSGNYEPQIAETNHDRIGFYNGLDEFLQGISGFTNGTHLVLTSRALPAALDHKALIHIPVRKEGSENLGLEGLDPESSISLLQKVGVKGTPDELKKVAELYAYHPLALMVLGTLLKKKYGGYLDRLPRVTAMDPRHELYKLFDEIRANLPSQKSTEHFLEIASHCIENPSLHVIAIGMSENTTVTDGLISHLLETAIMLADWNLINWDGRNQTLSLHPLVKNYFKSLSDDDDSKIIHKRLSIWYADLSVPENSTSLEDVSSRILAIKHAACSMELERAADLIFSPMPDTYSLFTWLGVWGHQVYGIEILGELANVSDLGLRANFLLGQAQMYHQLARPQLAIENMEEAIAIFDDLTVTESREVFANLAKALATRGNINRDIGSSKIAIKDYNRAIDIIEKYFCSDDKERLDLSKILVNRGNALRSMGYTSKAVRDYSYALKLWNQLVLRTTEQIDESIAPIYINRGIAYLSLGEEEKSISDFKKSISICMQQEDRFNQEKKRNLAHSKSLLGKALKIKSRQAGNAFICVSDAIDMLEKLVNEGRKDSEYLLASALVNRAKIQMKFKQWKDALHDCDKSIIIYQRLVSEAGFHFSSMLAHAQCTRAAVRYHLGDLKGSSEDRRRGFAAAKDIVHRWRSECENRIAYLLEVLRAINYLLSNRDKEGIALLDDFVKEIELTFSEDKVPEALKSFLLRSVPDIENLISGTEALGHSTLRLRGLIQKVKSLEEKRF